MTLRQRLGRHIVGRVHAAKVDREDLRLTDRDPLQLAARYTEVTGAATTR